MSSREIDVLVLMLIAGMVGGLAIVTLAFTRFWILFGVGLLLVGCLGLSSAAMAQRRTIDDPDV